MDKITLFYGKLDDTYQYHWLPLCFPLLASYLDLDKVEVVVIDERIEKENTLSLIDQHVPQSLLFGISSFTGFQLRRSVEIAKYVKSRFPETSIVWGGPHVTSLPKESLREDFVDVVVVNRGELVLPKLIERLKNKNLKNIPGVYWRANNGIEGLPNYEIADFGSLPEWSYDLLKVKEYLNPKTMILNLTTSWGCSNRCTFCYWYRNRNPWSAFSSQRVVREVQKFQEKYIIKKIYFNEANYLCDLKRSIEIARQLKSLGISYWVTARVNEVGRLSEADFKLLESSGLQAIFIGLESGSPRILKLMNKRTNLDDLAVAAKNSRNTEITLFLSLLFQIPGEQIEDVRITFDYVQKLKAVNPHIRAQTCSFTPLPNLPLTRLAARQGFKIPRSMEGWSNVVKKSRFEKKTWLTKEYAREYERVFNDLFPESQCMQYE